MKIRNGFVSNSSSSSFILAVQGSNEPCPHCHRKDLDLQDLIESRTSHSSDDTAMVHYSKDSVLEGIDERISRIEDELFDAKLKKQDDLVSPNSQWCKQTWAAYIQKTLEPELKELTDLKKTIKQAKGTVFECKISHHDELVRDMIRTMEKGGRLRILLKEAD